MEIVVGSVSAVAEKLVGPIWRKISYVSHHQSYVEELSQVLTRLKYGKEDVRSAVDYAMTKGEAVYEDVNIWLIDVERFTEEVVAILNDEYETEKRCFFGLCPNLFKRYNLSKQAGKAAREGFDLLAKGNFNTTSYTPAPEWTETLHLGGYEQFDSRRPTFQDIMEAVLHVEYCDELLNIFPSSMMRSLKKLEHLSVIECESLKEITEKADHRKAFSETISLKLVKLPNFENSDLGAHP